MTDLKQRVDEVLALQLAAEADFGGYGLYPPGWTRKQSLMADLLREQQAEIERLQKDAETASLLKAIAEYMDVCSWGSWQKDADYMTCDICGEGHNEPELVSHADDCAVLILSRAVQAGASLSRERARLLSIGEAREHAESVGWRQPAGDRWVGSYSAYGITTHDIQDLLNQPTGKRT